MDDWEEAEEVEMCSRVGNVCDEAETRESSSGQKGGKGDKTSIQLIVHRLGWANLPRPTHHNWAHLPYC